MCIYIYIKEEKRKQLNKKSRPWLGWNWKWNVLNEVSFTCFPTILYFQSITGTTKNGAWSCVWQKRSFKVMFELRFTQTQLHLAVWATFLANAAPPAPKPCLKWFKPWLWGILKKKKKNRLEIGAAFIKRGSNFYKREKLKFWGAIVGVKAWTFVLGLKPHLPIGMRPRRSKQLERP